MPRSGKHRTGPQEQHTRLALRVERYEACVGASVNHNAYAPQYGWDLDDDDPVYEFNNRAVSLRWSVISFGTAPPPVWMPDVYLGSIEPRM
jgi:hypothetical protein